MRQGLATPIFFWPFRNQDLPCQSGFDVASPPLSTTYITKKLVISHKRMAEKTINTNYLGYPAIQTFRVIQEKLVTS